MLDLRFDDGECTPEVINFNKLRNRKSDIRYPISDIRYLNPISDILISDIRISDIRYDIRYISDIRYPDIFFFQMFYLFRPPDKGKNIKGIKWVIGPD